MHKTQLNPWRWQDALGFSQGWRIDGFQSIVFVSGQVSISDDHGVMHEGDFEAQARMGLGRSFSVHLRMRTLLCLPRSWLERCGSRAVGMSS